MTNIEVKLLCRLILYMKIMKLKKGTGQYGLQGQAVVFATDITEIKDQIIDVLPRRITDIQEVIVVEKKERMKYHRQFKVEPQKLETAYNWLFKNNTLYGDVAEFCVRPEADYNVELIAQEEKEKIEKAF